MSVCLRLSVCLCLLKGFVVSLDFFKCRFPLNCSHFSFVLSFNLFHLLSSLHLSVSHLFLLLSCHPSPFILDLYVLLISLLSSPREPFIFSKLLPAPLTSLHTFPIPGNLSDLTLTLIAFPDTLAYPSTLSPLLPFILLLLAPHSAPCSYSFLCLSL